MTFYYSKTPTLFSLATATALVELASFDDNGAARAVDFTLRRDERSISGARNIAVRAWTKQGEDLGYLRLQTTEAPNLIFTPEEEHPDYRVGRDFSAEELREGDSDEDGDDQ